MIVNDSNVQVSKYVPMWNSDGQKTIRAIALEATTAMMPGALIPTDSGFGYQSFAGYSATGVTGAFGL